MFTAALSNLASIVVAQIRTSQDDKTSLVRIRSPTCTRFPTSESGIEVLTARR